MLYTYVESYIVLILMEEVLLFVSLLFCYHYVWLHGLLLVEPVITDITGKVFIQIFYPNFTDFIDNLISDVVVGSVFGFSIAYFIYFQYYPSLSHPSCHIPLVDQRDQIQLEGVTSGKSEPVNTRNYAFN